MTGSALPADSGPLPLPWLRLGLVLVAWLASCSYALSTLAGEFEYQSVLAELVIVPLLGLVLVVAGVLRYRHVWAGRLGHGDYVVAVGLAAGVALALLAGRVHDFNVFWLRRPDLLALPLVLALFLVLMLGMRALAPCGYGLAFTALAWPYPLTLVNEHVTPALTGVTFRIAATVAGWLGTADVVAAGDNVLRIKGPEGPFQIGVATACSGINSVVACALMGCAALYLVRGSLLRKVAWLGAGLVVTWAAAIGRIVLLTVSGELWGPSFTLGMLHSSAALTLDVIAFVAGLLALRWFGLAWKPWRVKAPAQVPGADLAARPHRSTLTARGLLTVGTASVLFLVTNTAVAHAAYVNDYLRNVPAGPVSQQMLAASGVDAAKVDRYDWSKAYFGSTSTWDRYRVNVLADSPATVYVDSILVDDRDALRVHSILECYKFHSVDVLVDQEVLLQHLVRASLMVVRQPDGSSWHALSWQWPVLQGDRIRYERVVLLATASAPAADGSTALDVPTGPDAALSDALVRGANAIVRNDLVEGARARA